MRCGIIYSATGPTYVAEAIASATSSLRFNSVPHLIFCDRPSDEICAGITFQTFEPSRDPYIDKVRNIGRSPFEQTIFLDTDTHVAAPISELFDLLKRFDIAAAHVPGYNRSGDPVPSAAFFDFNTGVIAYRKTDAVEKALAGWDTLHEAWLDAPPFITYRDQAAFRRTMWDSDLATYVLGPEYNYRSIFPGRLVDLAKIIHGRSTDYEKLVAHLNASLGMRTFGSFPANHPW